MTQFNTGPQDLGGRPGFGPINPEPNEPLFHAPWERRVLGFTLAMGATGSWTTDQSRHARETQAHETYWSSSYYEIWLTGLTKLMRERGMVTARDLSAQRCVDAPKPVKRVLKAADVAAVLAKGTQYDRATDTQPLFKVGDQVRAGEPRLSGHTRLPAYASCKKGEIVRVNGCHVFADSSADGLGDDPKWLYCVKFTAQELWGEASRDSVYLDLLEPYLAAV